ncbi:MAG: arginine deiminase [Gemmatimonadetes bacterium]|nr:arginine deiminase [Gemmatimonadota bacterium]
MSEHRVASEIGVLKKVIVHRPGLEVARLTPENNHALLFDDILWTERAQEEHDRFADILRSRGAEVLYFRDLLAETLADDEVRGLLIDEVVTPRSCGMKVSQSLRHVLRECEMDALLDCLLGGLLKSELQGLDVDPLFADALSDRYSYVLPPLPNLFFMRDNAAWLGSGVACSVLATPARARESLYLRCIYRFHPDFRDEGFPFWYGREPAHTYPASLEGGDVLVLDEKTVLVGCGERTVPAAAELLANRLLGQEDFENVVVAHFRKGRAIMHLDTVLTMVDRDKFNFFPGVQQGMEVFILRRGSGSDLSVSRTDGIVPALTECLGRPLQFIASGEDEIGYVREQWDDGHNTFAVAPGVVISYMRNSVTNQRLRDAGVEVLELDASELCRGRGGSRCMTQPILREAVDWNR